MSLAFEQVIAEQRSALTETMKKWEEHARNEAYDQINPVELRRVSTVIDDMKAFYTRTNFFDTPTIPDTGESE